MARRPPKTIANPDYLADPRVKDEFREALDNHCAFLASMSGAGQAFLDGRMSASQFASQDRAEDMAHFPEEYGLDIPENGAWIMVKHPPTTEVTVPVLSIWYARERIRGGMKIKSGRSTLGGYPRRLAEIQTPDGSLCLYPHEYTRVNDIRKWLGLESEGVEMHFMDSQHAVSDERVFYMQARGITRQQALSELLPNLEDGSFVYFTLPTEYAAFFGLEAA